MVVATGACGIGALLQGVMDTPLVTPFGYTIAGTMIAGQTAVGSTEAPLPSALRQACLTVRHGMPAAAGHRNPKRVDGTPGGHQALVLEAPVLPVHTVERRADTVRQPIDRCLPGSGRTCMCSGNCSRTCPARAPQQYCTRVPPSGCTLCIDCACSLHCCQNPRWRGRLCKAHAAGFEPSPIMKTVAAMSPILSEMLPCEIEAMVQHRASFKSDILLELLAGHIDTPEVLSRFATLAGELPVNYTAAQLAQCLLHVAGDAHDIVDAAEYRHVTHRGTASLLGMGTLLKKLGMARATCRQDIGRGPCAGASKSELSDSVVTLAATMAVCKAHQLPAPRPNLVHHLDQYRKLLAALPSAWQVGGGLRGRAMLTLFRNRLSLAMLEDCEPDWHNVQAQGLTAYGPDSGGALALFPKSWSAAMASDWTGVPAWHISMWVSLMQDALTVHGAAKVFNQVCQLPRLRQLVSNHTSAHGRPPCLHQLAVMATIISTGHDYCSYGSQRRALIPTRRANTTTN